MRPRGKRLRICKQIQKWLYEYLSQDLDPYDFGDFVADYLEEMGHEVEPYSYIAVDDLTPGQIREFTMWLQAKRIPEKWTHNDPYEAPPYLTLNARGMLPDGTWLIHFTNESPFRAFDRGSSLRGLHLTTWRKEKEMANCKANLSDERSLYEVIFGFAFEADTRNVLWRGEKYGRNAVLFQCDCAVSAQHHGDQEEQAIFPICSEYRVIPIYDVHGGLIVQTRLGREMRFDSLDDLIRYADERGQGLAGTRCAPALRFIDE